jgi:hypothetical protein
MSILSIAVAYLTAGTLGTCDFPLSIPSAYLTAETLISGE